MKSKVFMNSLKIISKMNKKIILSVAAIVTFIAAPAQTINGNYLDINNIKARINSDGSLFSDYTNALFEVPKGSGKKTIAIGNLWMGGFDASNVLKVAGQTYRQTGTDFWPGPLNSLAATDSITMNNFNRVWKLNQCDIDAYYNWILSGSPGTNPVDSTSMEAIMSWPVLTPDGAPLAPYSDFNSNSVYDPYAGDVPLIRGDQAIFFVYNDKGGIHTETGGTAIGLEIQGMAYAYGCPDDSALYNTIFTNYKIINKSAFRLDSTFIGNWTDLEIGAPGDDYVGCDVSSGAYYGYNGTSIDGAYGANPPSQGVVFLTGPWADPNGIDDAMTATANGTNYGDGVTDNERLGMSRFVYYINDFSVTGNPSAAIDFYNYLSGTWKDTTPWTYGGTGHLTGVQCDYMFPGTSDPLGYGTNGVPQAPWDETSAGSFPGDRRGLGSFGPFTFQPGAVQEIDFAYVYGRATSGGNLASVAVMQDRIDSVRSKFNGPITGCGCSGITGISSLTNDNSFDIYPNPSSQNITVNYTSSSKNVNIKIYDATGRLIKEIRDLNSGETMISLDGLNNGIYLLSLQDGNNIITKRFIKQ